MIPEDPVVAALESQAARPVADPAVAKPGATDPLRAAKAQIAHEELLTEAGAAWAEADLYPTRPGT